MNRIESFVRSFLSLAVVVAVVAPSPLWACACGCGVFDVGMSKNMLTSPGGFVSFEYDFMNQNKNWNGNRKSSDDNNSDKDIRTNFFTGSVDYMLNRSWGYMVEVPVWQRHFETTDNNNMVGGFDRGAVGDVRVKAVYAGLSADMSTGLTLGAKLPTGPFDQPDFDRDTQIGTGSTDLLLGGYHMGRVPGLSSFNWFATAQWDEPVLSMGGYRPGAEIAASLGSYYEGWTAGDFKIAPLAQVVASVRGRDSGTAADPTDSGYQRVFLFPGCEITRGAVRVYGDVGFPVYTFVNGNQLVAAELYKLNVGWSF